MAAGKKKGSKRMAKDTRGAVAKPGSGKAEPRNAADERPVDVNTKLRDAGLQGAPPVAERASVKSTELTPEPVWPAPLANPGDVERVADVLAQVAMVTDVGSLETVLRAVVTQAKKCRVKPDVLSGLLKA